MWQQNYLPLGDSLALSTLAAAIPIFVLLLLIGVLRKPAWIAGISGLGAGLVVAIGIYGMPVKLAISSTLMGAAFGLLPIAWIVSLGGSFSGVTVIVTVPTFESSRPSFTLNVNWSSP